MEVKRLQLPIDVPQAEFPFFCHVVELIVKGTRGTIDKDGFVGDVNVDSRFLATGGGFAKS